MGDVPWGPVGCVAAIGLLYCLMPVWRGRRFLFGIRVSAEHRGDPSLRYTLWAHLGTTLVSCWLAFVGIGGVTARHDDVSGLLVLQLFFLPGVSMLVGWFVTGRYVARVAGVEWGPQVAARGSMRARRKRAARASTPADAQQDRWRLVHPCLEPALWGVLATPVTLVVMSGQSVDGATVALFSTMVAVQAVGLSAALALTEPSPADLEGRAGELAALSEEYIKAWVTTLYWVRVGTIIAACGVLWTHLREGERLAEGGWPIGVTVGLGWGLITLVGVGMRVMGDMADRARMRPFLGDDDSETPSDGWMGYTYANSTDPRVIVDRIIRPGWTMNWSSPIAWALLAYWIGFLVIVLCVLAVWAPS